MDVTSKRISGIYKERLLRTHEYSWRPDSYPGQGVISVTEELPKPVDVWRTRQIYGHSDDSDRFQYRRHEFGGRDIAKVDIQTSGGDLSFEGTGQAIPGTYVEKFYGPPKAFQPLNSR